MLHSNKLDINNLDAFKEILINRGLENNACKDGLNGIKSAKTFNRVFEILAIHRHWLSGTEILHDLTELPENLNVYSLDLKGTQVKELPESIEVFHLDISYTKISAIPKNAKIRTLQAYASSLLYIDQSAIISSSIKAINTPLEQLPSNLKYNSSLLIESTNIKALPEELIVEADLNIRNTSIRKLPDSITVNGLLFIDKYQDAIRENYPFKDRIFQSK